jgi:hypothetical protein
MPRKIFDALSVCLLLAAAPLGCGQAPLEATGETQQAVGYGEPSGPVDDGIVLVRGNAGSVIQNCTGTLVAENLLLTARHCIAQFVDQTFSCTSDGELAPGSKGGQIGPPLTPSAISVRVGPAPGAPVAALGQQVFTVQSPSICRNDIALVVLDRAVTGVPIFAMRLDTGTLPSERVRVVGYGSDENNNIGTRMSRSGQPISQVGSSLFRPEGDPVPARTFVVEGAVACHGDSGGPALSEQNAVMGVFSEVVGPCFASTARDFFTEVAPFKDDLVLPAFAAANAEPILEPARGGDAGAPSVEPDAGAGAETNVAGGPSVPSAGTAGVVDEEPTYGGPRKAGGCKCRVGSPQGSFLDPESLLGCAVFGMALVRRRRRRIARAR